MSYSFSNFSGRPAFGGGARASEAEQGVGAHEAAVRPTENIWLPVNDGCDARRSRLEEILLRLLDDESDS